jgi:hypothetical protein
MATPSFGRLCAGMTGLDRANWEMLQIPAETINVSIRNLG